MSAAYPGAVKTFATRANGQTIDASHVNDLQDEVNAIEDGLLNGTAPLNSSKSTLVALSVTGGSTVTTFSAGASTLASLQVSGGSTFAGAFGVTGVAVVGGLRLGSTNSTFAAGDSTGVVLSSAIALWFVQSTGASTAIISTIAGIVRPSVTGDIMFVHNVGNASIQFVHANSSVTSSNQIVCPLGNPYILQIHEGMRMVYDGTFWRINEQST